MTAVCVVLSHCCGRPLELRVSRHRGFRLRLRVLQPKGIRCWHLQYKYSTEGVKAGVKAASAQALIISAGFQNGVSGELWRGLLQLARVGVLYPSNRKANVKMELDYRGKHILAPMVRVGGLPLRMLAAEYGADITYGEELVDHKFLRCFRRENEALGMVDFIEKSTNDVVFRTCDEEKDRVVFQIGTSDSVRALGVAQLVHRDVAAVDINMGCPKSFSVTGGMGAALLSKPELIHDILTTLKRNLIIPVTCKIRLLKTHAATVELARRIEKTGVAAIAVHGRKVADRPRDPAQWDGIAEVVSALSIPVIANGDIFEYGDFQRLQQATGAASVMAARAACWNPSVFRPEGKLPYEYVKREYLRKCILWENDLKGTKHELKEMIMHHASLESPEGKALYKSKDLADLSDLYGQRDYYNDVQRSRRQRGQSPSPYAAA